MDISLYFHPVDFDKFGHSGKLNRHCLGYNIWKDTQKVSWAGKSRIRVAIIGVPVNDPGLNQGTGRAPDEIRKRLYSFSHIEGFRGIVDLGNLKSGKSREDMHFALRDVIEYLSDNGIISLVLGGSQDITIGMARAFRDVKNFTLTVVDSRVNMKTTRESTNSSNFISKILFENPSLFHLQVIGSQNHLVSPSLLEMLQEKSYDCVHLGELRDNFNEAEPILRNTTVLSFDISAVRQSDLKDGWQLSASGFHTEEACRIAHYAGLSNKIKAFGLFEVNPERDSGGYGNDVAAQIVWYFFDALAHRVMVDPATDPEGFIRYFTEIDDHPIVFYRHPPTERWWMEVKTGDSENILVPCSEKDYRMAMKDEIPDKWWKYTRKTGSLSK